MRQLWVGIIVVIMALALGVGGAYGASLLVRNRLANLPATSTRTNRNTPLNQPGNNARRFNNPFMNPGGQPGFGPLNRGGRGSLPGSGQRGRGFFNNPVPNSPQTPGKPQVTPTPGTPDNGTGNGPF
jgi:hypothetical protein